MSNDRPLHFLTCKGSSDKKNSKEVLEIEIRQCKNLS